MSVEDTVRNARPNSISFSNSLMSIRSLDLAESAALRAATSSGLASTKMRWVGLSALTTSKGSPGQNPSLVLMKRCVSTKTTCSVILEIFAAAIAWSFFCRSTGSFLISSLPLTHLRFTASSNMTVPKVTSLAPCSLELSLSTTVVFPTPGIPTTTTLSFTSLPGPYESCECRGDFFDLLFQEHLIVLQDDVTHQQNSNARAEDPEEIGDPGD